MNDGGEYIASVEAEYGPIDIPEDDQRAILAAVWGLRSEIRAEITALTENHYGDWTDGDWHHRSISRALEAVEIIAIGGKLSDERTAAQDHAREQQEAARKR